MSERITELAGSLPHADGQGCWADARTLYVTAFWGGLDGPCLQLTAQGPDGTGYVALTKARAATLAALLCGWVSGIEADALAVAFRERE